MPKLSKNALTMPPHGVRVIFEKAAQVPGAIRLETGEPDFATPSHVIEAAVAAARNGFTKYTPNAGIQSLREAIAAKARNRNHLPATASNVVVGAGAAAVLSATLFATVNPGEEVLVPDPSWPNYRQWLHLMGARPVPYPLHEATGFLPDINEIERLITSNTSCIIINSPSNPTGAVFPADLMEALVALAKQHDLWVVSDEIYEDIVFDGKTHVGAGRFDTDRRVITVSGVSKSFAMTGWRIGYAIAPEHVVETVAAINEPLTSSVGSVNQKAAEAAIAGPREPVEAMVRAYQDRRDVALAVLRRHGRYRYTPQGTFYLMVDVSDLGLPSLDIALRVLAEAGVAASPGSAFGEAGEGFLRLSLASSTENVREGTERICRFLAAAAERRRA